MSLQMPCPTRCSSTYTARRCPHWLDKSAGPRHRKSSARIAGELSAKRARPQRQVVRTHQLEKNLKKLSSFAASPCARRTHAEPRHLHVRRASAAPTVDLYQGASGRLQQRAGERTWCLQREPSEESVKMTWPWIHDELVITSTQYNQSRHK